MGTRALAEAADIMPTLIDLAGLPPCDDPCLDAGETKPTTPSGLQGVSLMPALLNPPLSGTGAKQYAFSQFPRCNCTYNNDVVDPSNLNGTCAPKYHNAFTSETGSTGAANHHVCLFTPSNLFNWMGYSIRSDAMRYTIYVEWDGNTLRPKWDRTVAEELYDHSNDNGDSFDGQCSEPINLLGRSGTGGDQKIRKEADGLRAVLVQHF